MADYLTDLQSTEAAPAPAGSGGNFDFSKRDVADAASRRRRRARNVGQHPRRLCVEGARPLQASIFQTNADILKNQADAAELGVDLRLRQGPPGREATSAMPAKHRRGSSGIGTPRTISIRPTARRCCTRR
jgi:hypothetical protein